jgi:hypothetical protein
MKSILALALVTALASPAMADDIDLIKGKMTHEDYGDGDDNQLTEQLLTIKNNTSATITVMVECAFLRKDELLDAGGAVTIGNIKSGQSGYGELVGKGHADRTDCRISLAVKVDDAGRGTEVIRQ